MSASVFDHPWLSGLFRAPQIAPLWAAEAHLAHMRAYEIAWTEALAASGHVTAKTAEQAVATLTAWQPNWDGLRQGASQDGVVVPELVRQMRQGVDDPKVVHTGATSQDVIDTVLALTLKDVTAKICTDIEALIGQVDGLIDQFGDRSLMARTRMQAALPTQVRHRLLGWRDGLGTALEQARAQAIPLQIGGAVGDGQALGNDASAIATHMAAALSLPCPARTWQSDRSAIVAYGAWLMQVTGVLGKMGQDICLMAQQGVDEITLSGGGGSSAMPHKMNPVQAELLVTLARYTAGQSGLLGQAMVHEQERSGAAWALEWMVLPPMTMAAGSATHTAQALLSSVTNLGTEPR